MSSKRTCLRCGKMFKSKGNFNRICPKCANQPNDALRRYGASYNVRKDTAYSTGVSANYKPY